MGAWQIPKPPSFQKVQEILYDTGMDLLDKRGPGNWRRNKGGKALGTVYLMYFTALPYLFFFLSLESFDMFSLMPEPPPSEP